MVEASLESLALEYLRLSNAQEHLVHFATYVDPLYFVDPVHRLMAQAATDIVFNRLVGFDGKPVRNLIVNVSPQVGKSDLFSVKLPAFWFGHRPDDPIILTTYAAELAESKSKQIQAIIDSPEYQRLFPDIRLEDNDRSVANWKIAKHRGRLVTGGVKGGITGFGCMLAIIDDPYKNWDEAQSYSIRTKVEEFYRFVLRTRMWDGAYLICVMTRWHPADLTTFLARQPQTLVLRIPALCESQEIRDKRNAELGLPKGLPDPLGRKEGESHAPKRQSLEFLQSVKTDVGSLVFESMYQQWPVPYEGNQVKREWFRFTDTVPTHDNLIYVRYWDKAGTEAAGKYTSGVLMIYDKTNDYIYIEDVKQFQYSAGRREQAIRNTAEEDHVRYNGKVKTVVEQEPASGGKESAENTIYNLSDFDVSVDLKRQSKLVRFTPFAAKIEANRVVLKYAPWNEDFIAQVCAVPNTDYWDMVDAATGAYAVIMRQIRKKSYFGAAKVNVLSGVGEYKDTYLGELYRSLNIERHI